VNKWVNKLSENQFIILTTIHHNSKIKKAALHELADFSATAIDNNIDILKKEGVLERDGTKGGVWIIHYINSKLGK